MKNKRWSNCRYIKNEPTDPSTARDRSIEWDLLYGVWKCYQKIPFMSLKKMLDTHCLWFEDDCLHVLSTYDKTSQADLITFLSAYVKGVNSLDKHLPIFKELLHKGPWIPKIMSSLKPPNPDSMINVD